MVQKPKIPNSLGGVDAVAEMMNHMDAPDRERLLKELAARDPALTQEIEERMFTFEDLARIDDGSLQKLLHTAPKDTLSIALRSASPELIETIYRNLSARVSTALREEIAGASPVKRSLVEEAQKKIIAHAKKFTTGK